MFHIHTLHMIYHVSCTKRGRKLKEDVSVKLFRQEDCLNNFEGIKIDVPNFIFTSFSSFTNNQ
jgi:hypothetical protein